MGVTFVFEVISWAVKAPPYYWYVTDAVNSLRGVFVFFIFCWKRSVLHLLLARAPDTVRKRFVRTFGVLEPHRYPSFSSTCHPNQFGGGASSTRTQSTSTTAQNAGGNGSFQLSQFGSSASVTPAARRNSSARRWTVRPVAPSDDPCSTARPRRPFRLRPSLFNLFNLMPQATIVDVDEKKTIRVTSSRYTTDTGLGDGYRNRYVHIFSTSTKFLFPKLVTFETFRI